LNNGAAFMQTCFGEHQIGKVAACLIWKWLMKLTHQLSLTQASMVWKLIWLDSNPFAETNWMNHFFRATGQTRVLFH
jgi:hypothetical protein